MIVRIYPPLSHDSHFTKLSGDIYTYWSSDILDYGVSKKSEEAKVGNGGFCDLTNGNDMFALTIGNMLVDSVTLCPDAFTEKAELHETIAMGMASDEATSKKLGVTLESTSPRSLTLFHELIHLSSGTSNTKDVGSRYTVPAFEISMLMPFQRNQPKVLP